MHSNIKSAVANTRRHSIIRRSGGVTVAFVAGHLCKYGLFWGANRILDSGRFGVFFTAAVLINIAMAPATAVLFVLARRLAEISNQFGAEKTLTITSALLRRSTWTIPLALLIGAFCSIICSRIGIEAWDIAFILPITILVLTVTEILRTTFQSTMRFRSASTLWVLSSILQCAFGLAGLMVFDRVWAGVLGICVGAALANAPWLLYLPSDPAQTSPVSQERLYGRSDLWVTLSYCLYVTLNNIDVVLGYFLLSKEELDIYAASALLPKAVVTMTFAIVQVMIPVISEQRSRNLSARFSALKGLALSTLVALVAGGLLAAGAPFMQATPLAITSLNFAVLDILVVAAAALSVLRGMVVLDMTFRRGRIAFVQFFGILVLIFVSFLLRPSVDQLAAIYSSTVVGCFLMAAVLSVKWYARGATHQA